MHEQDIEDMIRGAVKQPAPPRDRAIDGLVTVAVAAIAAVTVIAVVAVIATRA